MASRPSHDRRIDGIDARPRTASLTAAIDTLMRAVAFLQQRAAALDSDGVSSDQHRATVLGNSLRELDNFLMILLDELALTAGLSSGRLRALRRRPTSLAKLASQPALFGHRLDDRARLSLLAAHKAVLLDDALKSGRRCSIWALAAVDRRAPRIDLHRVCAYYGRLAARIIRNVEQASRPSVQRRRRPAPSGFGYPPALAVEL